MKTIVLGYYVYERLRQHFLLLQFFADYALNLLPVSAEYVREAFAIVTHLTVGFVGASSSNYFLVQSNDVGRGITREHGRKWVRALYV